MEAIFGYSYSNQPARGVSETLNCAGMQNEIRGILKNDSPEATHSWVASYATDRSGGGIETE